MPKRGYHHGNLRQALVDAALELIADRGPSRLYALRGGKTRRRDALRRFIGISKVARTSIAEIALTGL